MSDPKTNQSKYQMSANWHKKGKAKNKISLDNSKL